MSGTVADGRGAAPGRAASQTTDAPTKCMVEGYHVVRSRCRARHLETGWALFDRGYGQSDKPTHRQAVGL